MKIEDFKQTDETIIKLKYIIKELEEFESKYKLPFTYTETACQDSIKDGDGNTILFWPWDADPEDGKVITYLLNKYFENKNSNIFLHCDKCNAPRKTKVCFKCNSETRVPCKGWEYPSIPDLEPLIKLARSLGYAIAKHGSMERDVDLIAVPWIEEAAESNELIYTLKRDLNLHQCGDIENKPNGRIALSLQFDSYTKTIDLSIMPKTKILADFNLKRLELLEDLDKELKLINIEIHENN